MVPLELRPFGVSGIEELCGAIDTEALWHRRIEPLWVLEVLWCHLNLGLVEPL